MFSHLKCLPSFRARRNYAIIEVASFRQRVARRVSIWKTLERNFPSASVSSIENWVMSSFFYKFSVFLLSAFYVFSSDTQAERWKAVQSTWRPTRHIFLKVFRLINSSKRLRPIHSSSSIVLPATCLWQITVYPSIKEQLKCRSICQALLSFKVSNDRRERHSWRIHSRWLLIVSASISSPIPYGVTL